MTDQPGRPSAHVAWLDAPLLAALTWERALYLLFVIVAILSRFYDLGARVMSHDESLHTYFSYLLATGKGYQHTPLMHGPFLFHVTALSYFLFGADDFTSRIPTAIFGVVLVVLPYWFRRWLGRVGALTVAFLLLISPSILYYARYIRQEAFILVWMTLTVLSVWRYLEDRRPAWLIGLSAVLALHAADKATSFLAVALFMIYLAPLALWQLYRARRQARDALALVGLGGLTAFLMVGLSILFSLLSDLLAGALGLLGGGLATLLSDLRLVVYIAVFLLLAAPLSAGLFVLYRAAFGRWLRGPARAAPAFDLIIVLVTTTMFMGSPAMLLIKNRIWQLFRGQELVSVNALGNMANLQTNPQVVTTMFAMALALIVIAIALGLAWDVRRWPAVAAVFLAITITLFTTVFTNLSGLGTGFVGQLGYWMAQQDVQRGNQPWYYYFLFVPMYEYTALAGALCGMALLAGRLIPAARAPLPLFAALHRQRFPLFLAWWVVGTWLTYTIAGEKMPWLIVHFALPLAFLAGWFVQQLSRAFASAAHLPARWLGVAGLAVLTALLFGRALSLLGGMDLADKATSEVVAWLLGFAVAAIALGVSGYALGRLANSAALPAFILASGGVLSLLTVRTAVLASYINYDYTREFLFYAHGAPGVKIALEQIDELRRRIGGAAPLRVGYTQETSWPFSWYMQLRPGSQYLGGQLPADYESFHAIIASEQDAQFAQINDALFENYLRFDYIMIWWPMQDYFDLTWERLSYSLFHPQARAALWEIAFNRNFEPYAKLFGKTSLRPENWSPSHRFSLFIRRDIAEQVWEYRVGTLAAGAQPPALRLQQPAGLALGRDGARFVVDRRANRVFHYDAAGQLVRAFGGPGGQPGKFNEPWGIAVDEEGFIYVADTFNHRIQKFDPDGNLLLSWGRPGATDQPGFGTDTQFFGPRDIAFDRQGRLLVTDTGNKRVQVFDRSGNFIAQFGSAGSGPGQLNEPVGIAVDAAGNIYIADVWNRRIQVFDPDFRYLRAWQVAAWDESRMDVATLQAVDHKPYLAIANNTLFVTSPRTGQVLAYTLTGSPLELPAVALDPESLPVGIEASSSVLLVTDQRSGQVLEFPLAFSLPSDRQ